MPKKAIKILKLNYFMLAIVLLLTSICVWTYSIGLSNNEVTNGEKGGNHILKIEKIVLKDGDYVQRYYFSNGAYEEVYYSKEGKKEKWISYDKNGKWQIEIVYDATGGEIIHLPEWNYESSKAKEPCATDEKLKYIEVTKDYTLDDLAYFSEGKMAAKFNDKYGYIDKKGEEVIGFIFDRALPFKKGIAAVCKNGKWGYIDKSGKEVIPCIYDNFGVKFGEGLLLKKADTWYYAEPAKGKTTKFNYQYDQVAEMSEGLAAVKKGSKWGYIDSKGKLVIHVKFDDAGSFNEGIAPVRLAGKWTYIDKNGKQITNLLFDRVFPFCNGVGVVIKGNDYGAIDARGKMIISPKFSYLGFFLNGVASAILNDKVGVIDKKGKVLIDFKYNYIGYFFEGLAVAKKGNKYGYIDMKGKEVIPFIYDYATDFICGMAIVEKDNYSYIINKNNQIIAKVKKPNYISNISEDIAIVKCNDKLKGLFVYNF